jgi:hypothetical protein
MACILQFQPGKLQKVANLLLGRPSDWIALAANYNEMYRIDFN